MKYIMIPALCLLSGVAAANEYKCDMTTDIDTSFQGSIEQSRNYKRETFPYVDDTRRCLVNLEVKVKDTWYPTSGTYIFGPDMTENSACKNAETTAKENILRKTIPEKLNKIVQKNCTAKLGDEPPKPKAAPIVSVQSAPIQHQVAPIQQAAVNIPNHYILPNNTIICKKLYMTVWIDGREQLAFEKVCK